MTKEATMRKIVAGLTISLDGVVESPANWGFQFINEEMNERIRAGIAQADAILLGRRTYLEFADLWPKQPSEVPMADFLNQTPKYVVSGTLDRLDWGPATQSPGTSPRRSPRSSTSPARTSRSLAAPHWCAGCCNTGCSMNLP
jgi:RibD C-terminal domain